MDAVDGSSVAAGPLDMGLRTVVSALNCAISTGDWSVVGDAVVMVQQLEVRYRPADLGKEIYMKEKP